MKNLLLHLNLGVVFDWINKVSGAANFKVKDIFVVVTVVLLSIPLPLMAATSSSSSASSSEHKVDQTESVKHTVSTQDKNYERLVDVSGAISLLVVLAMLLERALSLLFEYHWFLWVSKKIQGIKVPIAFSASWATCSHIKFDVLARLFPSGSESSSVTSIGIFITAAVVAGGSAGAITLFQGVLGFSREARESQIKVNKAKSEADLAEAQSRKTKADAEAETNKAKSAADLAEAQSRKAKADAEAETNKAKSEADLAEAQSRKADAEAKKAKADAEITNKKSDDVS